MGDGDLAELAVLVEHRDRAPVRDVRDRQPGEVAEHLLVVHRRVEHGPRLRHEGRPRGRVDRSLVEARVVDREREAPAEVVGEGEVGRPVVAAGARGQQRQRADAPAARHQRDDQIALGPQPLVELRLGVEDLQARPVDAADVGGELRLPGRDHPPDALGRPLLGAVAAAQLQQQALLLGVRVAAGELAQRAVVEQDVDRAPVGQLGHHELSDPPERELVVQRARQHARCLVEEPQRGVGAEHALVMVDRVACHSCLTAHATRTRGVSCGRTGPRSARSASWPACAGRSRPCRAPGRSRSSRCRWRTSRRSCRSPAPP